MRTDEAGSTEPARCVAFAIPVLAAMWKLSIVDDQGQKTVVNLVRDEYTVGRSDENAVRLTERNISRKHAIILRTKYGFLVEDCGSYNGVYLNGVRVESHHELAHKDLLQIGDYRVEVVDEDLATQEQGHQPFPSSVVPPSGRYPDRLVVLIGPRQGTEYPIESERFLLGRGDECDICLDHSSVSRVHAEVRQLEPGRFEIIDKGSANGLRINGHELPRALLDSRDVIELGDVVLKYIPRGQVFRASPAEGQRIAAWSGSLPVTTSTRRPTMKRNVFAAIGGAAIIVLAGVVFLGRSPVAPNGTTAAAPAAAQVPPAAPLPTALDVAEKQALSGDLKGAHATLASIDETDPLRRSPRFKELEARWARDSIDAARAESNVESRKEILDRVTRANTVSAELRDEAFSLLQETTSPSIDLSELAAEADDPKATRAGAPRKKKSSPHDEP